jgi:hypothetical protein
MRLRNRILSVVASAAVTTALTMLPTGGSTASAAGPGLQHYGAQLHVLWHGNTQANVDRELDLLQEAGATSARVDVSWSSLQLSGPGVVDPHYVARIDALVDGAARRDIRPVLVLHTTPCWASSAPETLKQGCAGAYWDRGVTRYPPTDNAHFAWAARWVAERYADRIAALELWNEPNLVIDGVTPLIAADQAGTYAAMVRAAYPAVKSVAPSLDVLAGALSFADADFLAALYGRGMKGSYDGISVHPYNEWRAPGAAHDPQWAKYDYVLGLEQLRRTMTAHGDDVPVWVTEVGWTSCTVGADRWCVTRDQQAQFTERVFTLTAERFPWVRAVIAYNLRDKGQDPDYTEDNFGLVDRDYVPKPALAAMGRAFATLRSAAAPLSPPATQPASPAAPVGFEVIDCPGVGSTDAAVVLCRQAPVLRR